MKLPFHNDDHSKRVEENGRSHHEILYELRDTSLLDLTNTEEGNNNHHHTNGDHNGDSNHLVHIVNGRISHNGHDISDIADPNGNDSTLEDGYETGKRVMIDKFTQCELSMSECGDCGDYRSDYNGHSDALSPPPTKDAEVTVSSGWSSAGMNETIPITAKTAVLSDALLARIQPAAPGKDASHETIMAWKKELADREASGSSAPQQQQKPPTDDGPRHKLNNERDGGADDHQDRHLNSYSTWRARDRDRSSASTSSEDEIEKISFLEMGANGEDGKPDRDPVRETQPTNRPAKTDRPEPEEEEGECAIRCLAYTLQCCECVIS